jgi:flagellar protein FlaJ
VKISEQLKAFVVSWIISILLILIGAFSKDVGVLGNTIILATFVIVAPQVFLGYKKYREFKDMEEKFPAFLRDLIESLRSGMSVPKAIQATSRLDYGKLTKEVRKMSNQISWGMTLDKVLDQFSERVKRSKRLSTSVQIIKESYFSGGDIISTLESVSENTTILRDLERERRSSLSPYVLLMYAISLIFVAIVVSINRFLSPIFSTSAQVGEFIGLANPCPSCADAFSCAICGLFQGTAQYIFFIDPTNVAAYYTSLFFFMSIIQAIFSGLVAGQISENSISAGVKHSLILTGIIFGSFSILIRLGLFGI